MNGAYAGAGQHRDGELGDHGQVDLNTVALFDTLCFQDIGELADFLVELLVGYRPVFSRFIAFPLNGNLVASCLELLVQTVVRDIEFPALKVL